MRNRKIIKRKQKKGFTLIELLAVILILGIIALIAIPTVNNVISEARKGAFKSTVQTIITQVERQCQIEQLKGVEHTSNYNFSEDGMTPNLEIKGSLPIEGIIYVDDECNVEVNVSDDNYTATKEEDSETIIIVDRVSYENVGELVDDLLSKSNTYTYMGGTYLKGLQNNNYLWYSGNLYRIMGKDENDNIRLISAMELTNIAYHETDGSPLFTTSYIKNWLNDYFYNHLSNPNILQNTSYCSDTTEDVYSARESCTSSVNDTKVTTISLDEYRLAMEPTSYSCSDIGLEIFRWAHFDDRLTLDDFQTELAGDGRTCIDYLKLIVTANAFSGMSASFDEANDKVNFGMSYIDDENIRSVWTLTPTSLTEEYTWIIETFGYVYSENVEYPYGVRPVITIPSNISIKAGYGTKSLPVMIEDTIQGNEKLIDKATSGEYVTLEGNKYRVVETISGVGTKLVLDKYLNVEDTYTNMITKMKNNTYLANLNLTTTDSRLVNYTWDRGNYIDLGDNYTGSLASTSNTFKSYVGGVRIGEMYAAYSHSETYFSENEYWAMTLCDDSRAWYITQSYSLTSSIGTLMKVRPVIMISEDVMTSEGNGTLLSPYKI